MKIRFALLLALLTALLAFGAAYAEIDDYDYDYDCEYDYEGGNPAIAPEIYLPANPSTGYQWMFTVDDPCVDVTDNGVFSPDTQMLGAPGTHSFRLNGAQEGYAQVTLRYGRNWEDEAMYTFVYQIIVNEHLDVMIYQIEMQ